jgi:ribonuclease E
VEHYVSRESQTSLIGNVYLGRVQNVLPSMEAAFIDIGKGRNAVLYAGEVNWEALGAKNGTPRKIEAVLKSGQPILVQVTKDPVGHKGARLTSQVSLPGRFLVYVPDGTTSGISRKLPDTERNRLKTLLKEIVPETAGVIVRTAAEGASEDELTRDVERLTARWSDIESKVAKGNAPQLLYGEPDLTLKVVRDLFTEDFSKLVIAGDDAWDMVEGYVTHVAPDLAERLEKYDGDRDVFAAYRIDEQIEKALDRKVWLPSGGSLVIDRTEAMTVVDVNTGKFTGSGGNLEETVTKNNLEAAEEIVRQLRLRDIGGIIVVDFIDMVLESNRDLVLRRMVECLGRDRTRHQVAEVTSLGLVQMTRKRIGTGLLEAFSESCDHCQARGLILHHEPVEPKKKGEEEPRRGRRGGRGKGREESTNGGGAPSPKDVAAMARPEETEKKGEERAKQEPSEPETGTGGENGAGEAAEPAGTKTPARSRSRGRGGRGRDKEAQPAPEEPASEPVSGEAASAPEGAEAPSPEKRPERETPAEGAQAPAAAPTETETAETKGADEASAEVAPAEPVAPAAPKIVTTVRRRGARRAAGPPSGAAAESTAAGTSTTAVATAPVGQPEAESARGESADEPADAEPLATLLDAAEVDGSGPDGSRADSTDDPSEADPVATPHVPVKKKGSRRR